MTDQSGTLEYSKLARLGKNADVRGLPEVRIALLSDAASQLLVPLLRELFRRQGLAAQIYEAPFAAIELEAFNPSSDLFAFQPEVVVVLNATQALRAAFFQPPAKDDFAAELAARMVGVWDAIRGRTNALILQSTYVMPYERLFGNYDLKHPNSWSTAVAEINRRTVLNAREHKNVLINDVDAIASWAGRRTWFDERFWDLAKSLCAMEHLPYVAKNITDIVLATRGRTVKCVILDLDNTLWGGIIGDDGVDGIQLSAHGDGEAFYRFQSFLLALKNRGILLCVCSKNEFAAAIKPFEEHSEMVLRKDDITIFVANWNNKADNIRRIRESLEIGYDAMLFLDDNPFERDSVRSLLPEVIVPDLPEDPADYIKALSELNLFETTNVSAEDGARADLYRAEFARRTAASRFANIDEYLASLKMTIDVDRFEPSRLGRISQLLQRSNQFNLTTHRYNEIQCEELMRDPQCIPLYAQLRDRFGDHGLISIIVARPDPTKRVLDITDWLMSCRVLARGVEEFLMNYVVQQAIEHDLELVTGTYIPTAKNAMVKEFFARFGFHKLDELADGTSRWQLQVSAYQPRKIYLQAETKQCTLATEAV